MKLIDINEIKQNETDDFLKYYFLEKSFYTDFKRIQTFEQINLNTPNDKKQLEIYKKLLSFGFKKIPFRSYSFSLKKKKQMYHINNESGYLLQKNEITSRKEDDLIITPNSGFVIRNEGKKTIFLFRKKKENFLRRTVDEYETIKLIKKEHELLLISKKFTNVFISFSQEYSNLHYPYFSYMIYPLFHLFITSGLLHTKKNGNLHIYLQKSVINQAMKKIFHLCINHFEDYEIHDTHKDVNTILIIFLNYKDNIPEKTMKKCIDLCEKTEPYFYFFYQYLFYFYYLLKKSKNHTALGYKLDLNAIGLSKLFDSPQKEMKVVEDIDIDVIETKKGEMFIYQIEEIYKKFKESIEYTISKYIDYKDRMDPHSLYMDPDFYENFFYNKAITLVKYYEENNIPYNKTYLVFIKKYNKNIINKLYSLENNIHFKVMLYEDQETLLLLEEGFTHLKKVKKCDYDEIKKLQDMTDMGYKMKQQLIEDMEEKRIPKVIKNVSEDFARGVSQYVNRTFDLEHRVSNAYMKLWEIYHSVSGLIPNQKEVRIFHIAEAPGQWIHCTANYLLNKKDKLECYNWKAMSLNHNHPENIKKYGTGIFADDYGFIRDYPHKWLYGKDNTGDFTKVENIMWYREYIKDWCGRDKLHLITGDAGMNGENVTLKDLQMIDYAQMAMVAACGTKGCNSITKHFLPYIRGIPESYEGVGFFVGYLYIYFLMFHELHIMKPHTSNPDSGEFYVIGKNKRDMEEDEIEKIVNQLNNFEVNECLFEEWRIPESFVIQITDFVKKLSLMMTEQYDIQNMLLTCIIDNDEVIDRETKCKKYLSPSFTKDIQEKRFQEWIKMYEFES